MFHILCDCKTEKDKQTYKYEDQIAQLQFRVEFLASKLSALYEHLALEYNYQKAQPSQWVVNKGQNKK